ncbi:unnamed protein product, partial [Ectocarpus fasciculatus]
SDVGGGSISSGVNGDVGGGSISSGGGGEEEAGVVLPSFLHVIQRLVRDPDAIGAVLVDGTKAVPARYLCPAAAAVGDSGGSTACVRKTRELEMSAARRPAAADFGVDGSDAQVGEQVVEERPGEAATAGGDGTGADGARDSGADAVGGAGGSGQTGGDVAVPDGPRTPGVDGRVGGGGGDVSQSSSSGSSSVRSSHSGRGGDDH